jgi:hypothetical protein
MESKILFRKDSNFVTTFYCALFYKSKVYIIWFSEFGILAKFEANDYSESWVWVSFDTSYHFLRSLIFLFIFLSLSSYSLSLKYLTSWKFLFKRKQKYRTNFSVYFLTNSPFKKLNFFKSFLVQKSANNFES